MSLLIIWSLFHTCFCILMSVLGCRWLWSLSLWILDDKQGDSPIVSLPLVSVKEQAMWILKAAILIVTSKFPTLKHTGISWSLFSTLSNNSLALLRDEQTVSCGKGGLLLCNSYSWRSFLRQKQHEDDGLSSAERKPWGIQEHTGPCIHTSCQIHTSLCLTNDSVSPGPNTFACWDHKNFRHVIIYLTSHLIMFSQQQFFLWDVNVFLKHAVDYFHLYVHEWTFRWPVLSRVSAAESPEIWA